MEELEEPPPPPGNGSLIWLIEKELNTLRRHVEQELISGLQEKLHKTLFETLMGVAADPDFKFLTSNMRTSDTTDTSESNHDEGISLACQVPPVSSFTRQLSGFGSKGPSRQISDGKGPATCLRSTASSTSPATSPKKLDHAAVDAKSENDAHQKGVSITPSEASFMPHYIADPESHHRNPMDEEGAMVSSRDEEDDIDGMTPSVSESVRKHVSDAIEKMVSSGGRASLEPILNEKKNSRLTHLIGPLDKHSKVATIVRSDIFDYVMSVILIINSICIGARADWEASHLGVKPIPVYLWLDRLFCVIFVVELLLRLYTYRFAFYIEVGWQWAYFDTAIVVLQVIEEITLLAAGDSDTNLGFLKMLKLGRLIRMVRMVRLMPELKSIVLLIAASMSAFFWTCVLLLLLVYMLAVYMVMMAVESLEESIGSAAVSREELQLYWGSVGSAILSLYWSITGGQDWAVVIGPLVEETDTQVHNIVFAMFIAFATMVLMNLVTGVFVEGAARLTKEDRDKELSRMAHKVFRMLDDDRSDEITRDEFDRHLVAGNMDVYLRSVDLDYDAADNLFEILDTGGNRSINITEFVEGCLRLKGLPRSADILQLLLETRQASQKSAESFHAVTNLVQQLRAEMKQMPIEKMVKKFSNLEDKSGFLEAPVQNVQARRDGGYESEAQVRALCLGDPQCKGYVLHTKGKFFLLDHGTANLPGEHTTWAKRVMVKQPAQEC